MNWKQNAFVKLQMMRQYISQTDGNWSSKLDISHTIISRKKRNNFIRTETEIFSDKVIFHLTF